MPVPRDAIVDLYRYILGREPESADVVESMAEQYASVAEARLATLRCKEFANQLTSLGVATFAKDKWVKTDIRNGLSMWVNLGDPYVSRACLYDSWEEPVVRFILGRLAKGDVFVDIGANIGWFTLLAAQKFRELGAGHVVSFEPRSDLFKNMERSVRENALDQYVSLYQMALADRAGPIELAWNESNPAASYIATNGLNPGGRHETVRSIRMDDVDFPGPVRLIKSDAEGAEALLFAGGQRLLRERCPVIVAELNIPRLPVVSGVSADAFLASMRDAGYSCRLLSDSGQAGPFVQTASDSNDVAANVVFFPNRERSGHDPI
jgi:FkbM family methyltransferase